MKAKAAQICPFLMMGTCASHKRGSKCGFSHGEVTADDVWCKLRVRTNQHLIKVCSNGPKCMYHHEGSNGKLDPPPLDPPAIAGVPPAPPPAPPRPPNKAWAVGFEGGPTAAATSVEAVSEFAEVPDSVLMDGMDD